MKKLLSVLLAFVMLASAGSLAVTANAAGKYSPGDVSGDGVVGPEDARLALRASVGLYSIRKNTPAFSAADVNNDGAIKADDARKILRASVGLEKLSGGTATKKTEFDYLAGGNCYYYGTATSPDGSELMIECARTPDSLYMLFSANGTTFATLTNRTGRYLISPKHQAYLVVDQLVYNELDPALQEFFLDPADFGFEGLSLADAVSVTTENVNIIPCQCYLFETYDGRFYRFYMNGDKLARFVYYNDDGSVSTTYNISYITDNVPSDKINLPSYYREYRGIAGAYDFDALFQ